MNNLIADILAAEAIKLNFISLAAGCVNLHVKSKKVKIPAANLIYRSAGADTTCDTGGKQYIYPDDAETGIVYFEDFGSDKARGNNKNLWQGKLKLICWLNMQKIGFNNSIDLIQKALISSLMTSIEIPDLLSDVNIKHSKNYPKRPGPFTQYSFDEERVKFLSHPYGYFACDLSWTAHIAENCPITITLNPQPC